MLNDKKSYSGMISTIPNTIMGEYGKYLLNGTISACILSFAVLDSRDNHRISSRIANLQWLFEEK